MRSANYLVAKSKVWPRIYAARCAVRSLCLVVEWTDDPAKARRFTYAKGRAVADRNQCQLVTVPNGIRP